MADKNLRNTVQELDNRSPVSLERQQNQQAQDDRKSQDAHNHHKERDSDPTHL